jgi:hypothetical protein
MFEMTTILVPTHVHAQLMQFLKNMGDGRTAEQVVELALRVWMRDECKTAQRPAFPAMRGYQWKSLFLPEGTVLRMEYKGQCYYAEVRGEHLMFEGRAYSPRQLAIHISGCVRNAWREFWIRCPGDTMWHLADTRRRILRRVIAPVPAYPKGMSAWRKSKFLHRDDILRDDQPDLTRRPFTPPGHGMYTPGRPGPRERRHGRPCPELWR